MPPQLPLDEIAQNLRLARRLFVVTGAGISAESGLPTYRGVGGLYNHTATDEGLSIEEALSAPTLRALPHLTWKYLRQIEAACRLARPNRAHAMLVALESRLDKVLILTQNVDGFHLLAGSSDVIDIHGDLRQLTCTSCASSRSVSDYADLPLGVPPCDRCGAPLRPRVVLFGEQLPPAKLRRLDLELEKGFDLYLSIGTTSVFPYIAGPLLDAARQGLPTVEINPGTTRISASVRHRLPLPAGEALEALLARVFPELIVR